MQLVPVPSRPALPTKLASTIDLARSIDTRIQQAEKFIANSTPGKFTMPSTESMRQALAAVEALAPDMATLQRDALAIGGPDGTHRGWHDSGDWQKTFDVDARWIGMAADTIARNLRAAIDTGAKEALGRARGAFTSTVLSARDLQHDVERLHTNQFLHSAASWASREIAEFDVDKDGRITLTTQIDTKRPGFFDETKTDGRTSYGWITDNGRLFRAADGPTFGNGDGAVTLDELTKLASTFDRNANEWVDIRELARVAAAYPSRFYYPGAPDLDQGPSPAASPSAPAS